MNALEARGVRARGIGSDLRALRKARGLTLHGLAVIVGRSIGWLSQVERDMTEPTLDDLRRLAQALDQPVSRFFGQTDALPDERGHIVRAASRRAIGTIGGGIVAELLSPDLTGRFEMLRVVFGPGAELTEPVDLPTEDAVYIVSGILEIMIAERSYRLAAGDAFRVIGEPIRWRNPGTNPCVAVWVIAPPIY
jgi:transcriptional regulator with XRE-family HTH domain